MNSPPPVLRAKLDAILHHGFIFIRNRISGEVTPSAAVREEIFQVADILELIPEAVRHWDDGSWPQGSAAHVREVVGDLTDHVPHLGERFQMLLDMPDDEYAAQFLTPATAPPAARAA